MKWCLPVLCAVFLLLLTTNASSQVKPSFSMGYGLLTYPRQFPPEILDKVISAGEVQYGKASSFGALTAGAKLLLKNNKLAVGCDLIFEQLIKDVSSTGSGTKLGESKMLFFTVLPRADYYYNPEQNFRFYSGAALGVSFASQKFENDSKGRLLVAFQATALGMEIGKDICFYAEAGFGYNGVINGGVRFRF